MVRVGIGVEEQGFLGEFLSRFAWSHCLFQDQEDFSGPVKQNREAREEFHRNGPRDPCQPAEMSGLKNAFRRSESEQTVRH